MNEYLLIVYGNSGCDYSLGCGINVIDLRTGDYNEARKKAMNIIYENLAGQEYAKYHEYKLDEDGFSRWELILLTGTIRDVSNQPRLFCMKQILI